MNLSRPVWIKGTKGRRVEQDVCVCIDHSVIGQKEFHKSCRDSRGPDVANRKCARKNDVRLQLLGQSALLPETRRPKADKIGVLVTDHEQALGESRGNVLT